MIEESINTAMKAWETDREDAMRLPTVALIASVKKALTSLLVGRDANARKMLLVSLRHATQELEEEE